MKKKTIFSVATSTFVTALAVVGVTYAATPAASNTSLLNKGTVEVDSLKVGKQDVGGVTFFNGTIVNNTTSGGAGVPVTFGDDVRVDGRVWRGATRGTADAQPFIIEDNLQVDGSLTFGQQTGYISISRTDFNENGDTGTFDDANGLYPGGGADEFWKDLQLPHGAQVTEIEAFYKDASGTEDLEVTLEKRELGSTSAKSDVAKVTSVDGQTSGSTSGLSELVDNSTNTYWIHLNFQGSTGDSLAFRGLKITYTFSSPS